MIDNLKAELPQGMGSTIKKVVGYGSIAVATLILVSNSYFQVEDGKFAIYQNTLFGTKAVVHGPSASFRMPGFSMDTHYKYSTTIDFDDAIVAGKQKASSSNPSIGVRFADTYTGFIPMAARLDLPRTNDEMLLSIHSSFRSYDNLVDKLYEKTLKDVVVNAAIQYTGEEFFQGALNEFKTSLNDQANNGIIETKRIKVPSESISSVVSSVGGGKKEMVKNTVMVWKTIPQTDAKGKLIRAKNPFTQYGIVVSQINIGSPTPEPKLETLLGKKKDLVAKKIEITQRQENAKAEAETAVLEGETNRAKEKQVQLLAAEKQIVAKEKEVKLAGLDAEKEKIVANKLAALSKIKKQQELDISTSNKDIESANFASAKFRAQAEKEMGFATAAVTKAKYNAINPKLYALEMQVKITANLGKALNGITVNMPTNMVTSGGKGGAKTSTDVVMDLIQIDKLNELATAASKK